MKRILVAFGTRPEAIKVAPVIAALKADSRFDTCVCTTGQHRELLDQALQWFGLEPDIDLSLMRPGQDLTDLTARSLTAMRDVLADRQPDWVLVQGDTTSAMTAALGAYYQQIPVGHIEAGLRTGNIYAPFPEEVNRRMISQLASLHFAPTQRAADTLKNENIDPARICVTGNTVIDALAMLRQSKPQTSQTNQRKLILVTGHRRESFGEHLAAICRALHTLAKREDVEIIYPVHPNPQVQGPVHDALGNTPRVNLVSPLTYPEFVALMDRAHLIVTDSGGVQEEAGSVQARVLVTRHTTERPEAVEAGYATLVGADEALLVREANAALDAPLPPAHKNPFGDGCAAQRIVERLHG